MEQNNIKIGTMCPDSCFETEERPQICDKHMKIIGEKPVLNNLNDSSDLPLSNRRCWNQRCNKKARLLNWKGFEYCLNHWYFDFKNTEGRWFYFKTTKFII